MGNVHPAISSSKCKIDQNTLVLEEHKLKKKDVPGLIKSLNSSNPNLKTISIRSCKLKELPLSITLFSQLNYLTLSDNKLSALPWSLPVAQGSPSAGSTMFFISDNLSKLDLSQNRFTEFPSSVLTLPNLVSLILDGNQLTSITIEIAGTNSDNNKPLISCKLRELSLANNNFTSFPDLITDLTTLQTLDLSGNGLAILPNTFSELKSLTSLNLKSNKFSSFPASICTLSQLKYLNLSHNYISISSMHHHLGVSFLPSLEQLELQHNKFGDFPLDICDLTSLKILKIQDNDIEVVPDKIGNLINLNELYMSENSVTTLPPSFGNLENLRKLFMEFNRLTKLPAEFSKLAKLTVLILHNNDLKQVPPEILPLKQLLRLSLDENPMSQNELKHIKSDGALSFLKQQQRSSQSSLTLHIESSRDNFGTSTQNLSSASTMKKSKKKSHIQTISRSLYRNNSSNLQSEKDKMNIIKQQKLNGGHNKEISMEQDRITIDGSEDDSTSASTTTESEDEIQKIINEQNQGSQTKPRRSSVFLPPSVSVKNSMYSPNSHSLPASFTAASLLSSSVSAPCLDSNPGGSISGMSSNNNSIHLSTTPNRQSISASISISSPTLSITNSSNSSPLPSSAGGSGGTVGSITTSSGFVIPLIPLAQTFQSVAGNNSASTAPTTPPTPNSSSNNSGSSSGQQQNLSNSDGSIPSFSKFKGSFDQLLEEQDFSKKKRESLQKLSKEQKWNLLLQYRNSTLKMLNFKTPATPKPSNSIINSLSVGSKDQHPKPLFNSGKFFCENLFVNSDVSLLKDLYSLLKEGGVETTSFIDYGGIEGILLILQSNLDHPEEFDEEKVGFCLLCIRTLVEYATKSVITTNNSINIITMFLNSDSPHIIGVVLETFDEILKLPNIGANIVLESLSNYQKVKNHSTIYVPLMALLKNPAYDIQIKALLFKIINTLIYSFSVLEERFSVICVLLKLGMLEIIQQLRKFKTLDTLIFELDIFEEVLDSDEHELIKKLGRKEVLRRMDTESQLKHSSSSSSISSQTANMDISSNDFVRVVMVSAGHGDFKFDLTDSTSYNDLIQTIQSKYKIKHDISLYGLRVPAIGEDSPIPKWVDPSKSLMENSLSGEIVEFRMKNMDLKLLLSDSNEIEKTGSFNVDPQMKCFEMIDYLRTKLDISAPAFRRMNSDISIRSEDDDDESIDTEFDIYGAYSFRPGHYNEGTWYPLNSRFLDFDFKNNIVEIKLMHRWVRIRFSGSEKLLKFDPNTTIAEITKEVTHEIGLNINIEDYGLSYSSGLGTSVINPSINSGFWLDPEKKLIDYPISKNTVIKFQFKPRFIGVTISPENGITSFKTSQYQLNNTLQISEIIEEVCSSSNLDPSCYSLYISNPSNQKIKLLSRQNCLRDQGVNTGDYLSLTSKQKDLPSDFNIWDEPADSPETINFSKENVDEILSISLNKMIEKITNPDFQDVNNMKAIFLLTFRSIITPEILLNKLVERHTIPTSVDKERGRQIQKKTRLLLKSWVKSETRLNRQELLETMKKHLPNQTAENDGSKELYDQYIELISKSYDNNDQNVSQSLPKPKIPKLISDNEISLLDMDEMEIARQLSLMLFPMFEKIETSELINQKWCKNPALAPNITDVITFFNKVSNWVSYSIVNESKLRNRSFIFSKFIKIADCFLELKNFHLLMAVLSGLNSSPILRLKYTKAKLSKHSRQTLIEHEQLMSTNQSLKNYRSILEETQPPCIPFMACHLSDLVFVDEGNQQLNGLLINFKKLEILSKIIKTIQEYCIIPYRFHPVPAIQNYFNDYKLVEDKNLYDMSLKCEPRGAERSEIE
eukprot:gene7586-9327_t